MTRRRLSGAIAALWLAIAPAATSAQTLIPPPGASGGGAGTVTSITCSGGLSGGAITTSGTCTLSAPVSVANGGTGQASLAAAGLPVLLATVTTAASQSSVTISFISGSYTDLEIRVFGSSAGSVANDPLFIQFNGDTGSNYDWYQAIITNGSGSASITTSGGAYATTSGLAGYLNGQSATVRAGVSIASILGYSGVTFAKVARWSATGIGGGTNSGAFDYNGTTNWRTTNAAITSIKLFLSTGPFTNGTVVRVYGLP
jgi:hypothetical protein